SCFTMIYVTDGSNVNMGFGSFKFFFCHFVISLIKEYNLILMQYFLGSNQSVNRNPTDIPQHIIQ
ncbi:MAG: hypothetical protein RR604_07370, partial [Eubacterium sp.]